MFNKKSIDDNEARIIINNLFAKEYEHPLDASCLKALKMNSAFDSFAKLIFEYGIDRIKSIQHSGSYVKVTEKNIPYIYNCVKEACEILDIDKMPIVYLMQDPYINAYTTNIKSPILCISNSAIKLLTRDELMFVIGHELGHIKSEHVQYHILGSYIPYLSDLIDVPYVKSIITSGLNIAYGEWMRSSEFTSDRAGLLVCQNLRSAITAFIKMGGYPQEFYNCIDINSFLEQATEFKGLDSDAFNKFAKMYLNMQNSHPWTVYRARELMLWVQSGEYSKILYRGSSWFKKTVEEENEKVKQLSVELEKMRASALIAEAKAKKERIEANLAKDKTNASKGMAQVAARAQETIEESQAVNAENAYEKVKQEIAEATKELEDATKKVSRITSVMTEITDERLKSYINEALDGLPMI